MAYFTESELLDKAKGVTFTKLANHQKRANIFLSHSHKDAEIAKGFIAELACNGVSVYVDWNDTNMPRITSGETARKIKDKIQFCSIFAILATKNAMASRWVPWEIGIADQKKDERNVFIIPVQDAYGRYEGNEYMQLYKHIEIDSLGVQRVVAPGQMVVNAAANESVGDMLSRNAVFG